MEWYTYAKRQESNHFRSNIHLSRFIHPKVNLPLRQECLEQCWSRWAEMKWVRWAEVSCWCIVIIVGTAAVVVVLLFQCFADCYRSVAVCFVLCCFPFWFVWVLILWVMNERPPHTLPRYFQDSGRSYLYKMWVGSKVPNFKLLYMLWQRLSCCDTKSGCFMCHFAHSFWHNFASRGAWCLVPHTSAACMLLELAAALSSHPCWAKSLWEIERWAFESSLSDMCNPRIFNCWILGLKSKGYVSTTVFKSKSNTHFIS